jgi:hypothetical protein
MTVPGGPVRTDGLGLACGALADGCFGWYTVSAKRMIQAGVNMLAAVPARRPCAGQRSAARTQLQGRTATTVLPGLRPSAWATCAVLAWFQSTMRGAGIDRP